MQRAHAKALTAAGILSPDECGALNDALDAIEREYGQVVDPPPAEAAEDLHTWIEDQLTQRAGTAGRRIHTGRSRNDQVATLLKLYLIDHGRRALGQLGGLVTVCCERARAWADLVFPLHTHQQFAAPGSVGFWVLRYAASFARVRERLAWHVRQWRRHCPLGAGAAAGSSIPLDRMIQASELGFEGPSWNALESTSTRDECVEALSIGAHCALHLQSLATDIIVFSQTPLAWTRYPVEFATGSSMMPNKSNPDAMELLRGESNAIIAAHSELLFILKGLPSGYNRDLQCVKPVVRRGQERWSALLSLAEAFLARLDFDPERLSASLAMGNITATLRMEAQVRSGVPMRDAHHAVAGQTVPTCGIDGPPGILESYQTAGGSSPAEVRRVADRLLASLHDESAAG